MVSDDLARPKELLSFGRNADGGPQTYSGGLRGCTPRASEFRPWGRMHLEIVRRSDAVQGFEVLPKRWLVKRTFAWFVKQRRWVRAYEVKIDHSEAMF